MIDAGSAAISRFPSCHRAVPNHRLKQARALKSQVVEDRRPDEAQSDVVPGSPPARMTLVPNGLRTPVFANPGHDSTWRVNASPRSTPCGAAARG